MKLDWLPAAFEALTSIGKAKDIRDTGGYEASMFRTNAALSRKQAEDAMARGESKSMSTVVHARSMVGAQKAALAAQGVDVSSGSALDVQVNTGKLAELDIMVIRNNAIREAWGFNVQATDYENQALLKEMQTKNKSRSTLITGGLNTLRLL